jgi:putative ABC transport system permease protein
MWNDLRYGARVLRTNPGFTVTAAVTLAVGIGLNATLFSIINFLLFKPIPVADAHELVWMAAASTGDKAARERFTLPDVLEFRAAQGSVSDVIAFAEARIAVRAPTGAVRAAGHVVTPNYFAVLGIAAAAGRTLSAGDDRSDGEIAAVISHAFAQRLFGSARDAVDKGIEINGHPWRIGWMGSGDSRASSPSPADCR